MFTGLVETLATVREVLDEPPGKRLFVQAPAIAPEVVIGESIALNGCCLTVVAVARDGLAFQAGPETLRRTNLGMLRSGSSVNLERSLKLGDRLGGHFVTGHIDGLGTLAARQDDGDWCTCWFAAPRELTVQMAGKGSVAVDGVSLTLVDVEADRFSVALIPHTLAATTLGRLQVGDRVNLETDVLAKYVQRQLAGSQNSTPAAPKQPGC
jgi:riboflavin synthase